MEGANPERAALRATIRRGNRLHAAHLVLCATFALWRTTQAMPAWSAAEGATWPSTTAGRALALASGIAGVAALATVVLTTLRTGRDATAWLLLLALLLALAWRRHVDAFDLVYVAFVLLSSTWWYTQRRQALRERVVALG